MSVKIDCLLKNGTFVTVNEKGNVIKNGFMMIKGQEIYQLGEMENLIEKDFEFKEIIDCKDCVIMPGLVNTHCHSSMTLLRGYKDDVCLEEWLNKYIWPIEGVITKDPKKVKLGAEVGILEMIKSGTTTFCDMYFHMKGVGEACEKAGIRGFVGETIFDAFPCVAGTDLEYFKKDVMEYFKNNELVYPCVAPHSAYTCSIKLLKELKELANKNNILFSVHCSESKSEVETVKKNNNGKTPVELLYENGILDKKTVLAHCVHLTDKDIEYLKKSGAFISHNISSNFKLNSGGIELKRLIKNGLGKQITIGTDGAASNNNLNMFKEISFIGIAHKFLQDDPTFPQAEDVIRFATINGARALGLDSKIGSLEKNKKADFIILDFKKPHLQPIFNVFSHLVYSVLGSDVKDSMINGQWVMKNRKVLTVDEDETIERIQKLNAEMIQLKKKLTKE